MQYNSDAVQQLEDSLTRARRDTEVHGRRLLRIMLHNGELATLETGTATAPREHLVLDGPTYPLISLHEAAAVMPLTHDSHVRKRFFDSGVLAARRLSTSLSDSERAGRCSTRNGFSPAMLP